MGEPEDLLIEGARLATVAARDLWRRLSPPAPTRTLPLARVRRRLELLVTALSGAFVPLVAADPPAQPTWLARLARRPPRHLAGRAPIPSTDGRRIHLPPALDASGGEAAPLATYRLLAVEQAARVARRTPDLLPGAAEGLLLRDLYLLAEAAAVDRALAGTLPGLLRDLLGARRAALAARPALERLTPVERAVERLLRELLADHPASPRSVPAPAAPAGSLAWARTAAARLSGEGGRYRGLPPVPLWGCVTTPADGPDGGTALDPGGQALGGPRGRSATLRRRPAVRPARDDEDDPGSGIWMITHDEPMESVEDPMGLARPADRDAAASPEDLADSLSELPEARVVRTPGEAPEVLASDAPPPLGSRGSGSTRPAAGIVYPEWDWRAGAYRPRGAVVRPGTAPGVDSPWPERALARHARLVRQVRRRFEALRPRRARLSRQADGPELDLAACVTAVADRAAGHAVDDRLYAAARPARRDTAIALLVDVSASTDGWISERLRIVDAEKEALLVLVEALGALGDPCGIFAFSGEGAEAVVVSTLKGFGEPAGPEVRRRIAALEPDRYTRVGAAIRHVTALLSRQEAGRRLLLVLSDGRPNDEDGYEGRYGIEDTRQAVAEARRSGLYPFCLTVDREAPAYLPSMFGRGAFAVLPRPERLPAVLVDLVRRLMER